MNWCDVYAIWFVAIDLIRLARSCFDWVMGLIDFESTWLRSTGFHWILDLVWFYLLLLNLIGIGCI